MERADARLINYIQQATRGGCMLLRTLGLRGKALERDHPERAGFLLAAVRSHPLYKGGRLAFDMLELEDLMLDAPATALLNDAQLAELLSAVAANSRSLIAATLGFASGEGNGSAPPPAAAENGGDPVSAAVSARTAATGLPRISLRPSSDPMEPSGSSASHNGPNIPEPELQLLSSDYLYDYVILGFLDMLGRQIR